MHLHNESTELFAIKIVQHALTHPVQDLLLLWCHLSKAFISSRNPDEDLGGVMVLGGSDPTLYEGEMTYVNVDAATYWQITMDG